MPFGIHGSTLLVFGMDDAEPEVGLRFPLLDGVAKHSCHMVADEVDPLGVSIGLSPGLPHHSRNAGDDCLEAGALFVQPLRQLLRCRFQGLHLINVYRRADVAVEHVVRGEVRRAIRVDPSIRAVMTAEPVLVSKRLPCLKCRLERGEGSRAILGEHRLRPPLAELLRQRSSGERQPAVVDIDAATVAVHDPGHGRRSAGQELEIAYLLAANAQQLGAICGEEPREQQAIAVEEDEALGLQRIANAQSSRRQEVEVDQRRRQQGGQTSRAEAADCRGDEDRRDEGEERQRGEKRPERECQRQGHGHG